MGGDPGDDQHGKPSSNARQVFEQALAAFSESLDRLYVERGAPPLRELASRGRLLSSSNISEILSGRRLPSMDVTIDLVRALMSKDTKHETEQRVQEWCGRWQEVKLLQRRVPRTSAPNRPASGGPTSVAADVVLGEETSAEIGSASTISEARAEAARIISEASDEAARIIAAAHAEADSIRSEEPGDRLPGAGAGAGSGEVAVFTDQASFYEATRRTIANARRRVYVTYFGSIGPDERDIAFQRHLKACRRWANSSSEHVFRRVMINAHGPSMADFFQQELDEMLRARASKRHYSVRVLGKVAQDVGGITIGIYDDEQVFISYVSGGDRMVGLGIRSREVVRDCFEHYYDHLWSSATDIDKASIGQVLSSAQ